MKSVESLKEVEHYRRKCITGEGLAVLQPAPHLVHTVSVECRCNVTICPPTHTARASSSRWAIYHEAVSSFTLLLVGDFVSTTRKETKTRESWLS